MIHPSQHIRTAIVLALITSLLAACGGGGSSADAPPAPPSPAPVATLTLLAGQPGGSGYIDGPASSTRFSRNIQSVTRSHAGELYVIDGLRIRKQSAQGLVSTFGKLESSDNSAASLTTDASGNLYVIEARQLRKVAADGSTVWRKGTLGSPPDDALGTPVRVANDPAGNIYLFHRIYESGQTLSLVRRVAADGQLTTVADLSRQDIAGASVAMDVDAIGNIFLASGRQVWKVNPLGQITPFAGAAQQGAIDGKGTDARFCSLRDNSLTVDRLGNLYVADSAYCGITGPTSASTIRKISPDGIVTTLVASSDNRLTPADGPAAGARLGEVHGLFMDQNDKLLIADRDHYAIRQLDSQGQVSTVVGPAAAYGHLDGDAKTARFNGPGEILRASNGDLYVNDGRVIRKIAANGTVSTLAGSPDSNSARDGTGSGASFLGITAMAMTRTGTLVVADERVIRLVSPEGVVTTLAGNNAPPICSTLGQEGKGTNAVFGSHIVGLAVDAAGSIYASEFHVNCGIIGISAVGNVIRKISPDGTVSSFVGKAGGHDPWFQPGQGTGVVFSYLTHLVIDSKDNLYAEDSGQLLKVTPSGAVSRFAQATDKPLAYAISSMSMDSTDTLYVVTSASKGSTSPAALKKVTPDGVVTPVVTAQGQSEGAVITGSTPDFGRANGLAISPSGLVYVSMEHAVYTYGLPGLAR